MARNIALLSSEVKILTIFFVQILLTCDPKVSNASARERVRGTLQKSVYTGGEEKGLGLRDGVSGLDLYGGLFTILSAVNKDIKFADTS